MVAVVDVGYGARGYRFSGGVINGSTSYGGGDTRPRCATSVFISVRKFAVAVPLVRTLGACVCVTTRDGRGERRVRCRARAYGMWWWW